METEKILSNEQAIEELDKKIEELAKEVEELGKMVENSQQITKAIIKEFNKKKIYLQVLVEKKEEIESLDVSFGSKIQDKRAFKTEEKIEEVSESLEYTTEESTNKFIKLERSKLNKALERLTEKKGKIEERQRCIVNKKLIKQIKKANSSAAVKNAILEEDFGYSIGKWQEKKEGYEEKIEKAGESKHKVVGAVSGTFWKIPTIYSSVAQNILEFNCNALQKKNIILEGITTVPSKIAISIKERIEELNKGKRKSGR